MSMLAERKRKQKYITNFRGATSWSQDGSKFGQRMLERMGWKEGKGLGRNEDGLTKNVSVVLKNDMEGLGFKECLNDSLQCDNFSQLLQQLTNDVEKSPESVELKSLEKKSEMSRVRVHYAKFTRGKDLSKYSEKDLANIFGKKEISKDNKEMQMKVDSEISGGSMRDYFRKFSYKFKKDLNEDSDSATNNQIVENDSLSVSGHMDEAVEKSSKISKKRKRSEDVPSTTPKKSKNLEIVSGVVNCGFDPVFKPSLSTLSMKGDALETSDGVVNPGFDPVFKPSPSYLSKKCKNLEILSKGVVNPVFDPMAKPSFTKRTSVLHTIEENVNEVEILEDEETIKVDNTNVSIESVKDEQSFKKKKKDKFGLKKSKKSKHNKDGIDNPVMNLNDSVESSVLESSNLTSFEVERKKKGKSDKSKKFKNDGVTNGVINDGFDINGIEVTRGNERISTSTFKKKPKGGIANEGYDVNLQNVEEIVSNFTDTIDQCQAEVENGINESKVKKNKVKRKSNKAVL